LPLAFFSFRSFNKDLCLHLPRVEILGPSSNHRKTDLRLGTTKTKKDTNLKAKIQVYKWGFFVSQGRPPLTAQEAYAKRWGYTFEAGCDVCFQ